MNKIFKTLVLTATTAGMLFMSIPVSALANVGDKGAVDPGKLISAEELPKGAVVKGTERIDNTVYAYDEEGNLISADKIYSGEDDSEKEGTEQNGNNKSKVIVQNGKGGSETKGTDKNEVEGQDVLSSDKDSSKILIGDEVSSEALKDGLTDPTLLGTLLVEMIKGISVDTTGDGPLTPDGNMTLLDDYGDKPNAGKQFITLTTRSGAEFYLIIDRDDHGLETVHFLNKVDESDILAYMEEDEKTAFEERKTALEEEKAAFDSENGEDGSDGRSETDDKKVKDNGSKNKNDTASKSDEESTETNDSSLIIVIIAFAAGIASIVYIFVIKKKKGRSPKNAPAPEPDEYEDDPDDDPDDDSDEGPDDDSEIKEGDSDEDV